MKLLQVHNKYKQRGGEGVVFDQEYELLKNTHIEVKRYVIDNRRQLDDFISKLKLIFKTHYSNKYKDEIKHVISKFGVDLMHVHNFFPLLTPSIFEASKEKNIPSVLTLHNYRLIHPNGLLLHDGKIDERSVKGSAYRCVLDGVYRDSILQTLVVAHMIEYHRKNATWKTQVDQFIALTEFAKSKFIEGGVPGDKITVKPNFIEDPIKSKKELRNLQNKEDYYIYIGRISKEKGIQTLIKAWKKREHDSKLLIFGDGPLYNTLVKATENNTNIIWKGYSDRSTVFQYLKYARAMIFPSICYEGFPLAILEALALGVPVISSNIGSQAEIIQEGETGLRFKVNDWESLNKKVIKLNSDSSLREFLSKNAREEFLKSHTPEKNKKKLLNIYKSLF